MGWLRKRAKQGEQLIGRWAIDPSDTAAKSALGDILLDFDQKGNLIYRIKEPDKDQIILLTYRIDGDRLLTDQPSHPNLQSTNFTLSGDQLTLDFEGVQSKFVRST